MNKLMSLLILPPVTMGVQAQAPLPSLSLASMEGRVPPPIES